MSDIIERLRLHDDDRLYQEADVLMAEAADEIERLREELAALKQPAQEPSAIFNGLVDCGDTGAYDLELLKMIPRGAQLFTRPQPTAEVELDALITTKQLDVIARKHGLIYANSPEFPESCEQIYSAMKEAIALYAAMQKGGE